MKRLALAQYEAFIDGGTILAEDAYGPKVIEAPNGRIIKLFRTKRLLTAARWNPYATRFAKNAQLLTELGIPTVNVEGVYRVTGIARDIVVYCRLDGHTLRDVLADPHADSSILAVFAQFLASLHAKGVLFRSIHFGNVLRTTNGPLGIIDVADMRVRRFGALKLKQRARNFRHMLRYEEDRAALRRFGIDRFITRYAEYGETSTIYRRDLEQVLNELVANRQL